MMKTFINSMRTYQERVNHFQEEFLLLITDQLDSCLSKAKSSLSTFSVKIKDLKTRKSDFI